MVKHVLVNVCNYDENKFELEEMEDNHHTVIVHCGRGFLHRDSTKELRERAIHVSATAKTEEEWPLTVFLTDIEARYNSGDIE